ncbi:unnamed protein product [Leptidea sinapis]|uniref:Uncharacterized protein n=1 Tax=Leptidea sinapis TaxID=189913 RepID=A0A5E4QDU9_9NEOP|nr:unnamed protein product [Leptidea sinapis]
MMKTPTICKNPERIKLTRLKKPSYLKKIKWPVSTTIKLRWCPKNVKQNQMLPHLNSGKCGNRKMKNLFMAAMSQNYNKL